MNIYQAELYHYGIKGQKYGVRRFQKEDGSLTEAGRKRYAVGVGQSDSPKKSSGSNQKSSGLPSMKASISSRRSGSSSKSGGRSSSRIKSQTSTNKDETNNSKYNFDQVGPIREPISVTMKKNKEKNRKVISAYIGPNTSVDEISNEASSSAAASYTTNSRAYSKPVLKVKKSRYYSAGVNYVQQMLV